MIPVTFGDIVVVDTIGIFHRLFDDCPSFNTGASERMICTASSLYTIILVFLRWKLYYHWQEHSKRASFDLLAFCAQFFILVVGWRAVGLLLIVRV